MATTATPMVLIVEDEFDLAKSFMDMLKPLRLNMLWAADGQDAMTLLVGGLKPDLIILDLFMPKVNGWEFLDAMEKNDAFRRIPVLVLSAWVETDLGLPRAKLAGVLTKPTGVNELMAEVSKALGLKQPANES